MTTETKFTVGEYKTRDGRKARVYATDGAGNFPLHGAVLSPETEEWEMRSWDENGNRAPEGMPSGLDLMPPLREWWVCQTDTGAQFLNRARPDKSGNWVEIIHVREVRDDQA